MSMAPPRSRRTVEAAVVVGLAALWGFNYVLIGIAVKQLDPAVLSCLRALGGGVALVIWKPRSLLVAWGLVRRHPTTAVVLSLVAVSLPLWLLGVAEHNGVSAGATAVVLALSPALIAISAPLYDDSERLSSAQWIGAAVATAGVAVVVGSAAADLGSPIGLIAILSATVVYAASSVLAKLLCHHWPAREMAVTTLLVGGLLLVPPALGNLPGSVPSLSVIAAMALLAVLGTGMSFLFLYSAIKFGGAGFSLRPVYLSPVFSVIGGAIFLGQAVTQGLVIGFVITCVGVALSTSGLAGTEDVPV
jgi:drug/metabolite transporter (DMT)-like permease